jgi:hypothetical protein
MEAHVRDDVEPSVGRVVTLDLLEEIVVVSSISVPIVPWLNFGLTCAILLLFEIICSFITFLTSAFC